MNKTTFLILGALLLTPLAASEVHDGSLSDSNIHYIGRWDRNDPNVSHSYWSTAYLRTNDVKDGNRPTDVEFAVRYADFIRSIRAHVPDAEIVAMRPFGGFQAGGIRQGVDSLATTDKHVHYVDTEGWLDKADFVDGIHPSVEGHAKAASRLAVALSALITVRAAPGSNLAASTNSRPRDYAFHGVISRKVLENYLSRAISIQGMFNGSGNLDDNIRMIKNTGAKFIGRSFAQWGKELRLLKSLETLKSDAVKVHAADPDVILEACIFEIITNEVDQVPVPAWVLIALKMPVEQRDFRYADMLYPPDPKGARRDGRFRHDMW